MIAGEAEVVGEHMAIEFFAELSTEGAAECTSSEPAEDGTRDCAEGDAKRTGNSADSTPPCGLLPERCSHHERLRRRFQQLRQSSWLFVTMRSWGSYTEDIAMTWGELHLGGMAVM